MIKIHSAGRAIVLGCVGFIIFGCADTRQTRIGNQLYITLKNPDQVLNAFAVENSRTASASGGNGAVSGGASVTGSNRVVPFSDKFNNITAQTMALSKAAVIGYNFAPADSENRRMFWQLLDKITTIEYRTEDHYNQLTATGNVRGELDPAIDDPFTGSIGFWTPSSKTYDSLAQLDPGIIQRTDEVKWQRMEAATNTVGGVEPRILNFTSGLTNAFPSSIKGFRFVEVTGKGWTSLKKGYWWHLSVENMKLSGFVTNYFAFWTPPSNHEVYLELTSENGPHVPLTQKR